MATRKFIMATGKTAYVVLTRDTDTDDAWSQSAGEPVALASATWGDLDIAATEQGSTGVYKWTIPASLPAGAWTATAYHQIGASPASTDVPVWSDPFEWDGSDFVRLKDVPDAVLDQADGVETGLTFRQALRVLMAVLAGKVSGAGTPTNIFRAAGSDAKVRVTSTVDASGNRSDVTIDGTP